MNASGSFSWITSDSKSPLCSRTLLSIFVDSLVRMVLIISGSLGNPWYMNIYYGVTYFRWKWIQRLVFKSWTRFFAFHIALILLRTIWIHLFSLQLWVDSRVNWTFNLSMATSLGEGKFWKTCLFVWVYGISTFVGYLRPNPFFLEINSSISNNSV